MKLWFFFRKHEPTLRELKRCNAPIHGGNGTRSAYIPPPPFPFIVTPLISWRLIPIQYWCIFNILRRVPHPDFWRHTPSRGRVIVSHQAHKYFKCMLRQIQQIQYTLRISVQLHMEQKYYVLMKSENIVKPHQLMTFKVKFIFSNIITSDMFRLEYIKWQHVTTLVIKLFITTNIGFCSYKGSQKCN